MTRNRANNLHSDMQINLTTMNSRDFNERSEIDKRFISHDVYLRIS